MRLFLNVTEGCHTRNFAQSSQGATAKITAKIRRPPARGGLHSKNIEQNRPGSVVIRRLNCSPLSCASLIRLSRGKPQRKTPEKAFGPAILPKKTGKSRVRMPVGAFSRRVPWGRYPLLLFASDHNPLDLIERDLVAAPVIEAGRPGRDRKSTRLNSSHANISYAVF